MTRRRFLRAIRFTAILLAAFLLFVASAHASVDWILERQLTTDPAEQSFADVSATKAVYLDERKGDYYVYGIDLTTGVETQISTGVVYPWTPQVDGNNVVYSSDGGVYVYDFASGKGRRITPDGSNALFPAISGRRVVYVELGRGPYLYCYDLVSGKETTISADVGGQSAPAISGNHVVWEGHRNGNFDLFCYDFATGLESAITTRPGNQVAASVSGDTVVYLEEGPSSDTHMWVHTLSTGDEYEATTGSYVMYPDVSGSKVVYTDYGNTVYCLDLESGIARRLIPSAGAQWAPSICGGNVVYQENSGNTDIWLGELAIPRMSARAAATTVPWNGSTTVSGALTTIGGIPMAGRIVQLEESVDGISWRAMGLTATGASGAYSLPSPTLTSARYLRANFPGIGSDDFSSQSPALLVKPRASLGTPACVWTMYRTRSYSVTGSLRPTHTLGSSVGTLYCYRLESGRWKLRKSFTLKSATVSGRASYKTAVRLPYTGRWRMRAYHSDSGHAPTYSAWRYVTVK